MYCPLNTYGAINRAATARYKYYWLLNIVSYCRSRLFGFGGKIAGFLGAAAPERGVPAFPFFLMRDENQAYQTLDYQNLV